MSNIIHRITWLHCIIAAPIFILVCLGGYQILKAINFSSRHSSGERLFADDMYSNEKEEGTKKFDKFLGIFGGDYRSARDNFQASLKKHRSDPVARIYEQNSIAIDHSPDPKKRVKIAVVVPMSSNANVAQEILRGVSQVQCEVNNYISKNKECENKKENGVKGMPLEIEIFDDGNNAETAKEIANYIIHDDRILAVIGSNAAEPSREAAPIYEQAKLVTIGPTSWGPGITGKGSYIFRTTPPIHQLSSTLAEHILREKKTKLAICFDSESSDSRDFKNELIYEFTRLGGVIVEIDSNFICDLAKEPRLPDATIKKVFNIADALFISSHINRLPLATTLINDFNRLKDSKDKDFPLYSSPTLYTYEILEKSGSNADGLTLVTPWPTKIQTKSFDSGAQKLWESRVNWRTAMSFDAAQAIVAGLKGINIRQASQKERDETRKGLQKKLHDSNFSADGASDKVKFLPTGDRVLNPTSVKPQIVKVKDKNFTPIPTLTPTPAHPVRSPASTLSPQK